MFWAIISFVVVALFLHAMGAASCANRKCQHGPDRNGYDPIVRSDDWGGVRIEEPFDKSVIAKQRLTRIVREQAFGNDMGHGISGMADVPGMPGIDGGIGGIGGIGDGDLTGHHWGS